MPDDCAIVPDCSACDFSANQNLQEHYDQLWSVVCASAVRLATLNTVPIVCFHRDTKKADFLFVTQPTLTKYKLSSMRCEVIKARDGLELPAYLSLPVSADVKLSGGLPMVLNVHGGPWARDAWGFRPDTQWFANRGYAVLQVSGKLQVYTCCLVKLCLGV